MTPEMPSNQAQPKAVALFVSDVHLQESLPHTTTAFLNFLQHHAINAAQLYILGDLFEYWAGDDDIDTPYHRQIINALRMVGDAGVVLYWIAGNRDFLVGDNFARATGATRLQDPYVTTIAGKPLILTHGDAQCIDDADYMAFRKQVRNLAWQQQFLSMPLAQRKTIIENMREQSRAAQRGKTYEIMDVNQAAIEALFDACDASIMIHGHTHRPARHEHAHEGAPRVRYVLPDWDVDADAPRGGWLAIHSDGEIKRFGIDGNELR